MPSLQEPRLHLQQQETKCMTRVREERAAGIRETGGDTEKKQKEEEEREIRSLTGLLSSASLLLKEGIQAVNSLPLFSDRTRFVPLLPFHSLQ